MTVDNDALMLPSWNNLNCVIYALTFAKQILKIFAKNQEILDAFFQESSEKHAQALERSLLDGVIYSELTKPTEDLPAMKLKLIKNIAGYALDHWRIGRDESTERFYKEVCAVR